MKSIRLFIIFLSSISIITAQSNSVNFEDEYIKCYDTTFTDNGEALRGFLEQSEKILSEANVFKGISSESYQYFLNNSGTYTSIEYSKLGFINFMLGQLSAGNFDMKKFKTCTTTLRTQEGYKKSKMYHVEETLEQIKTANNVQDVTSKVTKILTLKDLDHIYYRLRILNFLETNGRKNLKPPNEKVLLSEAALKTALQIHIKAQDEISVNNKEVSFGELLQETKKYVQESTSNTLIALKTEENISKQFIMAIKKEISKIIYIVRNEVAIKKYQRSFEELTKTEQEEIQKNYPEKIVQI